MNHEVTNYYYRAPKSCNSRIQFRPEGPHGKVSFAVDVHVSSDEPHEVLELRGWIEPCEETGIQWGFQLNLRGSYVVCSFDWGVKHRCRLTGRRYRGRGLHKHYHFSGEHPRATYAIPPGEISIDDPNQALVDFAAECNIDLLAGFDAYAPLFPFLSLS